MSKEQHQPVPHQPILRDYYVRTLSDGDPAWHWYSIADMTNSVVLNISDSMNAQDTAALFDRARDRIIALHSSLSTTEPDSQQGATVNTAPSDPNKTDPETRVVVGIVNAVAATIDYAMARRVGASGDFQKSQMFKTADELAAAIKAAP